METRLSFSVSREAKVPCPVAEAGLCPQDPASSTALYRGPDAYLRAEGVPLVFIIQEFLFRFVLFLCMDVLPAHMRVHVRIHGWCL